MAARDANGLSDPYVRKISFFYIYILFLLNYILEKMIYLRLYFTEYMVYTCILDKIDLGLFLKKVFGHIKLDKKGYRNIIFFFTLKDITILKSIF